MVDGDELDEKIIAVPVNDPNYKHYYDIKELPPHLFDEMMHFFEVYKALEHKVTAVKEICHKYEAIEIIRKCLAKLRRKIRQTAAVISAAVRRIKIALFATKYK